MSSQEGGQSGPSQKTKPWGAEQALGVLKEGEGYIIFEKKLAGPVLGWTSAVAAYGAFLIPKIFATHIKAGTPEYALYGFALYYASCLGVNWWYYARKGAEIPC